MSKKRRMFDIEMPPEDTSETFPAGKDETRRGPMAAAITEASESARDRAATEAAIRAENDSLAQEHVRLKRLGLITDLVPLDKVVTFKLMRDRFKGPDDSLPDLIASVRDIGLSNPIRVERREDGQFELIQGYRRLAAYRALLAETGDAAAWGEIPAAITAPGETIEALYRRMVDENLVRKDISFAEMAQLAIHYAMDPQTDLFDAEKAVGVLFQSTSYTKRSYIRGFIRLMQALGEDLRFAPEIPRALGLNLVARMDEVEGIPAAIRADLAGWDNRSVRDELDVLRRYVGDAEPVATKPVAAPKPAPAKPRAKTVFQLDRPQGRAKCVAANGKLELSFERDFSAIERRKLEDAVRALLDHLD